MKRVSNASGEITVQVFRRKVQNSELFALGISRLISGIHSAGRLSVVVQSGTILKSGYEEACFAWRNDHSLV